MEETYTCGSLAAKYCDEMMKWLKMLKNVHHGGDSGFILPSYHPPLKTLRKQGPSRIQSTKKTLSQRDCYLNNGEG